MRRVAKSKRVVQSKWLRLTEASNALDSLQRTHDFLRVVDRDEMAWKWVIISLHDALYGFMVCALTGSDPDNVTVNFIVRNGNAAKRLIDFNFILLAGKTGNRLTDSVLSNAKAIKRLIDFNTALTRCRKTGPRGIYMRHCPLRITDGQWRSIKKMQGQFRNALAHYQPRGWSIELFIMPDMILDVLAVLRFLLIDTHAIYNLHLKQTERKKLKSLLYQCPRLLKQSRTHRDLEAIKNGTARIYQRPTRSKAQQAFNAVLADLEKQQREAANAVPVLS
jgi:hypothetical protein